MKTRTLRPFLSLSTAALFILLLGATAMAGPTSLPQTTSNTPPVAHCSATPAKGLPGTVFTFSAATSSDAEDPASALKAKFDVYGSSDFRDQSWTPISQSRTYQYTSQGLHRIDLIVMDSGYLIGNTDCRVEVTPPGGQNTAPTASGTITTTLHVTTPYHLYLPSIPQEGSP